MRRRARQNKSPVAQILTRSAHDDAPLHVTVDNSLYQSFPNDPPFPRAGAFSNRIHNVTQTVNFPAAYTTSTTLATSYAKSFQLSDLDQVASFQALFDQYRIMGIEIRVMNTSFGSNISNLPLSGGITRCIIDYADATALSNVQQAENYQNCLTVECGRPFTRVFTPRAALAAYAGAFTSYAVAPSGQWFNTASSGVQHYGLKIINSSTPSTMVFDVCVRYWLQFKNIR